jgi:hypothetical protein
LDHPQPTVRKPGKGTAMAENLAHTAGLHRDNAAETTVTPLSPPGYELLDEIGHGGMGVVYRARDVALDRDVAVKLLSERFPADSPAAQRFLSEACITGQLQHPGIPAVHQVGTLTDGRPFLAMKLIKGTTLEAILKQRTDPSADRGRLLAIFEAVCQAVGYAHAHRVIHRDLKPANVMVGAFGEVQVMDWGLAKVLGAEAAPATVEARTAEQTQAWTEIQPTPETGSHTQADSLIGTPAFIPPEQAMGEIEKVDRRSDVFGLGALLAVILTGKPPYVGETFDSVRVQAGRGKLEDCFARLEACGAEPELAALCKKCLAFEPADRPADAGAVAQAVAELRAAADERARRAELERVRVEGERATAEVRAAERRKRRQVAVALGAAVLALVIIGGSGAWWWLMERRSTEREVQAALEEAARERDAERWPEARAALERASGRLGSWGLSDLRRRVDGARRDADMVVELDEIRVAASDPRASHSTRTNARTDAAYKNAFARYGIDLSTRTGEEAASTITLSPIKAALLVGLHDWLRIKPAGEREPLRALVEAIDDDAWRRSFRAAVFVPDVPKLQALASKPEALTQPSAVQFWLAERLRTTGGVKEAEALLREGQRQNPADFWLNYQLGTTLLYGQRNFISPTQAARPEEAVGYFRAAAAVRPKKRGCAHEPGYRPVFKTRPGRGPGRVAAGGHFGSRFCNCPQRRGKYSQG